MLELMVYIYAGEYWDSLRNPNIPNDGELKFYKAMLSIVIDREAKEILARIIELFVESWSLEDKTCVEPAEATPLATSLRVKSRVFPGTSSPIVESVLPVFAGLTSVLSQLFEMIYYTGPPELLMAGIIPAFGISTKAITESFSRIKTIFSQSRDLQKPILAVFDVHGVLLESTWKQEYALAYSRITGKSEIEGMNWVKANAIHIPEQDVIKKLAAESGVSNEEARKWFVWARSHIRKFRTPEAKAGSLKFIKALADQGGSYCGYYRIRAY
ncbi:MAG: hypothetical protein NTV30_00755, partial [Chloroflexi bacterium]|nr:hypothetical protein [Chloroflexota bacterium]